MFMLLLVFALIGLITGRVPRKNNLAAMCAALSGIAVFTVFYFGGSVFVDYLQLEASTAATIVYWCFAAFSVAYMLSQIPAKLKNGWHDATRDNAALRRAFEDAKNWKAPERPIRPPHRVHYSDRKCENVELGAGEVDRWATASNSSFEGTKLYRIVRILDESGNIVWRQ